MARSILDVVTIASWVSCASSEGIREGRQVGHLGKGGCTDECAYPARGGDRVAVVGAVDG